MSMSSSPSKGVPIEKENTAMDVKEGQGEFQKMMYPHPLIDVDCNLLHSDLASMYSLLPQDDITTSHDTIPNYFHILHHPSTILSNIQAVFSPSSTIQEAETLFPLLKERHQKRQKLLLAGDNNIITGKNHINAPLAIDIRMSVGVHPYHTGPDEVGIFQSVEKDVNERVERLLTESSTIANSNGGKNSGPVACIGETGLDYSEGFPDRDYQLPWFEWQLQLAKTHQLPLFIHERLAFDDTVRLLDQTFPKNQLRDEDVDSPPILIHCFTGTKDECKEYISRGYWISISGFILKNNDGADEVRSCLKEGIIPLDKLMIETDAPYMGFTNCRDSYYAVEEDESIIVENSQFMDLNSKKKKRLKKGIYPNVPSSLPKVLECVVECLNEGREQRKEELLEVGAVSKHLLENSVTFFGFSTQALED